MHGAQPPRAILVHRSEGGGIVDGQAFPLELGHPDDHVSRYLLSICQQKRFLGQPRQYIDRPSPSQGNWARLTVPLASANLPETRAFFREVLGMSNVFKTGVLLAVLTAMLVLIGGAVGGQQGMIVAFVLAAVMNFASYWFSDKIVLAAYGAQPIEEARAPRLYAVVR